MGGNRNDLCSIEREVVGIIGLDPLPRPQYWTTLLLDESKSRRQFIIC